MTESEARKLDTCPACDSPKSKGCIVCWDCFKYREGITPLKYANVPFEVWLRITREIIEKQNYARR